MAEQPKREQDQHYVFELNAHDVILGRGPPSFNYEGNFRFLEVIDSRRNEYRSTDSTRIKNRIAKEIMDTIHNNNGRFVREVKTPSELAKLKNELATMTTKPNDRDFSGRNNNNPEDPYPSSAFNKVYKIVSEVDAMEKIKNTLRGSRTSASTDNDQKPKALVSKKAATGTTKTNQGILSRSSSLPEVGESLHQWTEQQQGGYNKESSVINTAAVTGNTTGFVRSLSLPVIGNQRQLTEQQQQERQLLLQSLQEENQRIRTIIAQKDDKIRILELQQQNFQHQLEQQPSILERISSRAASISDANQDIATDNLLLSEHRTRNLLLQQQHRRHHHHHQQINTIPIEHLLLQQQREQLQQEQQINILLNMRNDSLFGLNQQEPGILFPGLSNRSTALSPFASLTGASALLEHQQQQQQQELASILQQRVQQQQQREPHLNWSQQQQQTLLQNQSQDNPTSTMTQTQQPNIKNNDRDITDEVTSRTSSSS